MESRKTPEIRFAGFSENWEEKKLKDLANFSKGIGYKKDDLTSKGKPVILYGRLYTKFETVIKDLDTFVKGQRQDILSKGNEVIIPASGESSEDIARASVITNPGIIIGGDLNIVTPNIELNSIFLALAISNGKLNKELKIRAQGNSIVHLHNSDLKEANLLFPALEEQTRIGQFFKLLDETIIKHQSELDWLKQTKHGFIQKMFPQKGEFVPKLRFQGFNVAWEQRRLRNTNSFYTDGNYGDNYPSQSDMADNSNGVPFLRGSDIKDGYLDATKASYITKKKHLELSTGHLRYDDVVIAVRGSLGALGYVNKGNVGWNINSQLAIIRTDKRELHGKFLAQYLLSHRGQKELLSKATGTALKQLPINQLKDILVPLPPIMEQEQIGNFFKKFDDTIALKAREVSLLKATKKAFLQKMFI